MGLVRVEPSASSQREFPAGGSPDVETRGRVLVADDDEDMARVIHTLFEVNDYEVVGRARDGVEAVAAAESLQPDVVILDYQMPQMRGDEAAYRIRRLAPDVMIVGFSAVRAAATTWADAEVDKTQVVHLVRVVDDLLSEVRPV